MKNAVRQSKDGVILDLEISPGAKKTEIQGYNKWRRRIVVKVSRRAEKGKANENIVSFFSSLFNISSRNVRIITGLTSSKKSIEITGLKTDDILKVLTEYEHKKT